MQISAFFNTNLNQDPSSWLTQEKYKDGVVEASEKFQSAVSSLHESMESAQPLTFPETEKKEGLNFLQTESHIISVFDYKEPSWSGSVENIRTEEAFYVSADPEKSRINTYNALRFIYIAPKSEQPLWESGNISWDKRGTLKIQLDKNYSPTINLKTSDSCEVPFPNTKTAQSYGLEAQRNATVENLENILETIYTHIPDPAYAAHFDDKYTVIKNKIVNKSEITTLDR